MDAQYRPCGFLWQSFQRELEVQAVRRCQAAQGFRIDPGIFKFPRRGRKQEGQKIGRFWSSQGCCTLGPVRVAAKAKLSDERAARGLYEGARVR